MNLLQMKKNEIFFRNWNFRSRKKHKRTTHNKENPKCQKISLKEEKRKCKKHKF